MHDLGIIPYPILFDAQSVLRSFFQVGSFLILTPLCYYEHNNALHHQLAVRSKILSKLIFASCVRDTTTTPIARIITD